MALVDTEPGLLKQIREGMFLVSLDGDESPQSHYDSVLMASQRRPPRPSGIWHPGTCITVLNAYILQGGILLHCGIRCAAFRAVLLQTYESLLLTEYHRTLGTSYVS